MGRPDRDPGGTASGVALLLLWLAGAFSPKVPSNADLAQAVSQALPGRVVPVRVIQVPLVETAVGTIRAVHETTIGSKLLAASSS